VLYPIRKERAMESLPRGDREHFEHWLLTEVVHAAVHHERLKKEGGKGINEWIALGSLSSLMAVLCRYTDRDPAALGSVATDYRALRDVIRNGSSHKDEIKRRVEDAIREGEGR
jgi:hypothetical protein